MRVFITGGTGLIGRRLVPKLLERGDQLAVLTRRPDTAQQLWGDSVQAVAGDPVQPGPWQDALAGCDAVVNLAGEGIFNSPLEHSLQGTFAIQPDQEHRKRRRRSGSARLGQGSGQRVGDRLLRLHRSGRADRGCAARQRHAGSPVRRMGKDGSDRPHPPPLSLGERGGG